MTFPKKLSFLLAITAMLPIYGSEHDKEAFDEKQNSVHSLKRPITPQEVDNLVGDARTCFKKIPEIIDRDEKIVTLTNGASLLLEAIHIQQQMMKEIIDYDLAHLVRLEKQNKQVVEQNAKVVEENIFLIRQNQQFALCARKNSQMFQSLVLQQAEIRNFVQKFIKKENGNSESTPSSIIESEKNPKPTQKGDEELKTI